MRMAHPLDRAIRSRGLALALGALTVAALACGTRTRESREEMERRGPIAERAPAERGDPSRSPAAAERALPSTRPAGELSIVARFEGAMPTGVTVSRTGRIFVNFPRWGDEVPFTVAELVDGKPVPFPNEALNRFPPEALEKTFVSVQSVVVDARDRLWVLDTGSVEMGPTAPGGPKLVGVDLVNNQVAKVITFPTSVALPTTYLNDVRFDLRRGKAGLAFITDSAKDGPNGIIVVDLESGRSWRKLHDHPSTKAEGKFLALVEGRPLAVHEPGKPAESLRIGSDGIAISADGETLFYTPLASRKLYSVAVDALADEKRSAAAVASTVRDLGEKGAADGLESDAQGRIYVTSYEQNAVLRRKPDGSFETLVADPRLLWPDTLSLADDGRLYVIANQLHRQPSYQGGRDLREKPYLLVRIATDGTPVRLVPEVR
jgi:sugar lactone lactonase YvrE